MKHLRYLIETVHDMRRFVCQWKAWFFPYLCQNGDSKNVVSNNQIRFRADRNDAFIRLGFEQRKERQNWSEPCCFCAWYQLPRPALFTIFANADQNLLVKFVLLICLLFIQVCTTRLVIQINLRQHCSFFWSIFWRHMLCFPVAKWET